MAAGVVVLRPEAGPASFVLYTLGVTALLLLVCWWKGEPPRWRDIDGRAAVVHGFRSSLKEWSLEHEYPDYLSERALAHSDKDKVRAAYARSDLLEQRKPMMDGWADFCTGSAKKGC